MTVFMHWLWPSSSFIFIVFSFANTICQCLKEMGPGSFLKGTAKSLELNHVTGLKEMVIPGGSAIKFQVNSYLQAV